MTSNQTPQSQYLDYLPALFRQSGDSADSDQFIGRFLLAFEAILTGQGNPNAPGLEEVLDRIHTYFIPGTTDDAQTQKTPEEFLDWLAGWVALSLREDWKETEKRRFISQIMASYRLRGTKAGLVKAIAAYTDAEEDGDITITDDFPDIPHYFHVQTTLGKRGKVSPQDLYRREKSVIAIIEQEKPAHTYYSLRTMLWTMQINDTEPAKGIVLGENSLLGTLPLNKSDQN